MIGGAAVLILTPLAWLGLGMFAAGFVGRLVLMVVNRVHRWKTRSSDLSVGGWWYNRKTRQVAESRVFRGIGWDGPYATPEDAARAREIARTRAAEWNAED